MCWPSQNSATKYKKSREAGRFQWWWLLWNRTSTISYRCWLLVYSAGLNDDDDPRLIRTCKPLQLIWELFPHYNEKITIIIEDDWQNCRSNPRNSYIIPPYSMASSEENANQDADKELLWLAAYLAIVKDDLDVRNASVFQEKKDSPTDCEFNKHTHQHTQLKNFVRARLAEISQIWESLADQLTELIFICNNTDCPLVLEDRQM